MPEQATQKTKRSIQVQQILSGNGKRSNLAGQRDASEMSFVMPASSKQKAKTTPSKCKTFDSSRILSPLLDPNLLESRKQSR
jgi:hypothetical protein